MSAILAPIPHPIHSYALLVVNGITTAIPKNAPAHVNLNLSNDVILQNNLVKL